MWIPLLAITELMAVEEAARFRDWYRTIAAGRLERRRPEPPREGFQALAEVRAFLAPIIAERRASPATDLISDLVTASYDGEPLSEEEIAATVVFLDGGRRDDRACRRARSAPRARSRRVVGPPRPRDDPVALAAFSAEALGSPGRSTR